MTHDYTLEARFWNVLLEQIQVPIHVWHGEDDRLVSPQASRIITEALPGATTHFENLQRSVFTPMTRQRTHL